MVKEGDVFPSLIKGRMPPIMEKYKDLKEGDSVEEMINENLRKEAV